MLHCAVLYKLNTVCCSFLKSREKDFQRNNAFCTSWPICYRRKIRMLNLSAVSSLLCDIWKYPESWLDQRNWCLFDPSFISWKTKYQLNRRRTWNSEGKYMTPKCTAIATAFENRKVTNDVILVIGYNLEIPFTTAKNHTEEVFKECLHVYISMNLSLQIMIGKQCLTRHWMSKSKRLIKIQYMSPLRTRSMSLETHGRIRYLVTWWTRCQVGQQLTLWMLNTIL